MYCPIPNLSSDVFITLNKDIKLRVHYIKEVSFDKLDSELQIENILRKTDSHAIKIFVGSYLSNDPEILYIPLSQFISLSKAEYVDDDKIKIGGLDIFVDLRALSDDDVLECEKLKQLLIGAKTYWFTSLLSENHIATCHSIELKEPEFTEICFSIESEEQENDK